MKKGKFLVALLVASMLLLTACGGSGNRYMLPHFDGMNADGSYDSDIFYRNDLTIFGGDSDVIWVPEERDPVYGGWFYQYTSGNGGVYTQWFDKEHSYAFSVLRSRDLNDWELCGAVDGGFAVELDRKVDAAGNPVLAQSDYAYANAWAPEVIYDEKTGWYVLYASFVTYVNDHNSPDVTYSDSASQMDRNYGSVCISDNPCGPFTLVDGTRFYTEQPLGEKGVALASGQDAGDGTILNLNGDKITRLNPVFDITGHFKKITEGKNSGIDFDFAEIDLSPFVDDDGTIYVYFAKHWLSETHYIDEDSPNFTPKEDNRLGNYMSIWGMRMKDAITPDYDSLTLITFPNYLNVTYDTEKNGPIWLETSYKMSGYHDHSATDNPENPDWEASLNEGPQMIAHTGSDGVKRYYLTYSQNGYPARDYGVHQAISTSPLGSYTKLGRIKSALGVEIENDYMTGVGHHALTEVDGELFAIYWVHADPFDAGTSGRNGRAYAFDRLFWTYDEATGYDVMYGNGPTKSLQFLPDVVTGYRNIAGEAKIKASGAADKKTIGYLGDGLFVSLEYYDGMEFRAKGKTKITLEFDGPRKVRGIAIYNSYRYEYAFAGIDSIEFDLAEKPEFMTDAEYNGKAYIDGLGFNGDYFDAENKLMRHGGASVASFDEITVNSITINISEKLSGKGEIRIADIAVLGR